MGAVQQVMAALGGVAGPVQGQAMFYRFVPGWSGGIGTQTWTVPAGVTSICVVCVQEGGTNGSSAPGYAQVRNAALTVVCRAQNGARIGDGGGDGGLGGTGSGTQGAGGGGAGGYAGDGGVGSSGGGAAGAGAGGGGGGGFSGVAGATSFGYGGGGVGLWGQGTNGVAGTSGTPGGGGGSGGLEGTQGTDGVCGGGFRGVYFSATHQPGGRGGALAYKNNIPVTPGDTIYIQGYFDGTTDSSNGIENAGVRIIWGAGRSFPSTNTGDV